MLSGSGRRLLLRLAFQPVGDDALGPFGDIGHGPAKLCRVGFRVIRHLPSFPSAELLAMHQRGKRRRGEGWFRLYDLVFLPFTVGSRKGCGKVPASRLPHCWRWRGVTGS